MELQLEHFAVTPLIDNVVKTIEPLAAKKTRRLGRFMRTRCACGKRCSIS